MQLEKMITEGSNNASAEIDRVSTLEMCRIINEEDKTVPLAVERVLPDIAAAIDVIHAQVSGGGRLIYLGAGTSGRLGILDYIDEIFTSETLGMRKDSPDIFRRVCRHMDAKPEETLVHDDSEYALKAAAEAGCMVKKYDRYR